MLALEELTQDVAWGSMETEAWHRDLERFAEQEQPILQQAVELQQRKRELRPHACGDFDRKSLSLAFYFSNFLLFNHGIDLF